MSRIGTPSILSSVFTRTALPAPIEGGVSTSASPVSSVFGRIGAVIAQSGDYTPAQVGLSAVTNAAQTLASIVPNTVPTAGQLLLGNAGGTAYAPVSLTGDVTITAAGAVTVSKFGGVAILSAAGHAAGDIDAAGAAAARQAAYTNLTSIGS